MKNKSSIYPLVSICMPTYNGEQFIEEALFSAIHQDYINIEIIVSDDNSKDKTLAIVKSFQEKTNIPIYIFNHEPSGIGANWNNCVKNAKGKYIKFLFQDDTLDSKCISKMMHVALKNPKVGLVYCKRNFLIDADAIETEKFISFYGNLHQYWEDLNLPQPVCSGKHYLKDKNLLNSPKNKIGEPTAVLLKKECFATIGWFQLELKQTLDYEYWYRVMKKYDIAFINEKLVSFRLHNNQASKVNKDCNIGNDETVLLYKEYYNHIFYFLHPKNKLKLLKLYHPFVRRLVKLKQYLNVK